MSYGAAINRDARRQTAIPRIEYAIKQAQAEITKAKHIVDQAKKLGDKAPLTLKEAEDVLATQQRKLKANEECLKNTRANSGKGTCAMSK